MSERDPMFKAMLANVRNSGRQTVQENLDDAREESAALRDQNEELKKAEVEVIERFLNKVADIPDRTRSNFKRHAYLILRQMTEALAANSSPRGKEGKRVFEPNTAAAYLQATGKRPEDDVEAFDKWWPGWQAEQPTRD